MMNTRKFGLVVLVIVAALSACSNDKSSTGPETNDLAGQKFSLITINGDTVPVFFVDDLQGCMRDGVYDFSGFDEERIDGGTIEFVTTSHYRFTLDGAKRCRPENGEAEWIDNPVNAFAQYIIVDGAIHFYAVGEDSADPNSKVVMIGTLNESFLTVDTPIYSFVYKRE